MRIEEYNTLRAVWVLEVVEEEADREIYRRQSSQSPKQIALDLN